MFSHALVIDPSPADTQGIKQRLISLGIAKVLTAGRAGIGLEEVRTKRKDPIDLIVLDIDQPDSRDIDAVINIRKEKSAVHIPLIVLCSSLDSSIMFPALVAGADECVTKEVFSSDKMLYVLISARDRRQARLDLRERKRAKFWSGLR